MTAKRSRLRQHYANFLSGPDKYLLGLLVFLLPFERIPSTELFGVTIRPSIIVATLVIARAAQLLYRAPFPLYKPWAIRGALLLYMTWLFVTIAWSINSTRGLQVSLFTLFVITTALAIGVLYRKEYLPAITKALLVSGVAVAAFGIYQYFGDLAGLPNWATGLRDRYAWQIFGFPRIQSVALEPLYFCSYLLIPTSVAIVRFLEGYGSRRVSGGIVVLFSSIIFLSSSRGGILALVSLILFVVSFLAFMGRARLLLVIKLVLMIVGSLSIALAVIATTARQPINDTINGGKKGSEAYVGQIGKTSAEVGTDDRSKLREQALDILSADSKRYIVGIGIGQFGPYIQNNAKYEETGWLIVNNMPLELLVELGLVGLAILMVFFASIFWRAQNYIRAGDLTSDRIFALAMLAYLFATAIQYQTFSTLYIMHIWVAIGLLMAIVLKNKPKEGSSGKEAKKTKTKA